MRVFPDEGRFCPADGRPLERASKVPVNAERDPRLGTTLCGRYELRRVVADGATGRVYEAIDHGADAQVAVKVLHDGVACDEVSLERFKREYEVSRSLPYTSIVRVLDFQHDPRAAVWLLVMEFLDGEELRLILNRETWLAPERLIRILSQIALGLDEAHQRHFVHRDLKPDNLFLCGTREGDDVRILDFGSVRDNNKNAPKLTALGTTIGSPYYMAPEQAQGLTTLDGRADVFALGAIAYECVTGSVPFTGKNAPSVLLAILTKTPLPPSQRAGGAAYPIPRALDDVLDGALAKNPERRTPTVGDFARAVGSAYGLRDDVATWAAMPEEECRRLLAASRQQGGLLWSVPPQRVADPFGASAAVVAAPAVSLGAPDGLPAGVPGPRPVWLTPAIVGIVALFLGGGLALLFLNR